MAGRAGEPFTRRFAEERSMRVHTLWERALLRAYFLNRDDESECL